MSIIVRPAFKTYDYPAEEPEEIEPPNADILLRSEIINDCVRAQWEALIEDTRKYKEDKENILKMCLTTKSKQELYNHLTNVANLYNRQNRVKTTTDNFQKHFLIGRGGFGHVYLVTDLRDNQISALKVVPKIKILEKNLVANIKREKKIYSTLNSNFIVKLISSFQDDMNLYFQMEYVPGGDLSYVMKKFDFAEYQIRFIIGELVLALEEIHNHNIAHLDIKPGNILFDSEGHIKLTDFGLSEIIEDGNFETIVGEILDNQQPELITNQQKRVKGMTLAYVAPEILKHGQPSKKSDIWSLGVIMYQLFYRCLPLTIEQQRSIAKDHKNFTDFLKFPRRVDSIISNSAYQLMRQLLSHYKKRPSLQEIKNSPFFEGFNFENYRMNFSPFVPSIPQPFIPSKYDCEDLFLEDETPEIRYSPQAQLAFFGFSLNKKIPGIGTLSAQLHSKQVIPNLHFAPPGTTTTTDSVESSAPSRI